MRSSGVTAHLFLSDWCGVQAKMEPSPITVYSGAGPCGCIRNPLDHVQSGLRPHAADGHSWLLIAVAFGTIVRTRALSMRALAIWPPFAYF